MTTTDTQFAGRFPDMTFASYAANDTTLKGWTPTESAINAGMLSDIGRATIFGPDLFTDNFYSRFYKSPLQRGNAAMIARFSEVTSGAYDPLAGQSALFDGQRSSMISDVAVKNLSRQMRIEVNDYILRQYTQTPEMIGDAMAAIMSAQNAAYLDDMWVACKAYFGGSTRNAQSTQMNVMNAKVSDAGFADEMVELLWSIGQNKFKYKSTAYNASKYNTRSDSLHIALKKDIEFPAFKKLYSETFNPSFIKENQTIDFVDSFPTPAGAPSAAGELIGMVVDDRAFAVTPMPDTLTTEAFRNVSRKSTMYATTYEYALQHAPMFNCAWIFAPSS